MNREDIIRMARENGFVQIDQDLAEWNCFDDEIKCFFQAAYAAGAAAERERIIAANAPEIEKVNAHIKALGDAVAAEREACAHRAGIALLGADRGLANRVDQAIRARGQNL